MERFSISLICHKEGCTWFLVFFTQNKVEHDLFADKI